MTDVYVFGSVNRDLIAVVEALPRAGETHVSTGFRARGGGKGANQAYAAARLAAGGGAVHLVACVGKDDEGRALRRELEEAGVDTGWMAEVDAPTGLAMIAVDADGENTIVVVPGANGQWPAGLVESVPLRPGDIVVCQLEIAFAVVADLASHALASGCRLVVNAAPFDARIGQIAARADVVVVNEVEAAGLLGVAAFDSAALMAAGEFRGDVIVTLGGRGSLVRTRTGQVAAVEAFPVDAVDTVGAGDAFVGALAAALAEGEPLLGAVELAMGAGALTVGVNGPRYPGLTRADIHALRSARERSTGR